MNFLLGWSFPLISRNKLLCVIIITASFLYLSCGQNFNSTETQIKFPGKTDQKLNYELAVTKTIPITDNSELARLFISVDNKVYGRTLNGIYTLHNNTWIKILSAKDNCNIEFFSVSNDLLLYSEQNNLLISRLKFAFIHKRGNSITTSEPKIIELPFSEGIYGIKGASKNTFIILGLLEYAVVEFANRSCTKYKITHFPIPEHPSSIIRFINNQFLDEPLLQSVDAIYRFDESSKYSLLIKLVDFPDPLIRKDNPDYYITDFANVCFGNKEFGIFKRQSKFYFFEKKKPGYITKSYFSLHLTNGDSIIADDRYPFIIKDKQNVFCLANGLLLKKTNVSSGFLGNQWDVILELPDKHFQEFLLIGEDHFVTGGKSSKLISRAIPRQRLMTKNEPSENFLFYAYASETPSSVYGFGIGNFENIGREVVYCVDILDNNKYFSNYIGNYPSNEASKRGVEGRRTINKTNNNAPELDVGVVVGDIDESGSDDLLVTNLDGANSLYMNNGKGYFKYSTDLLDLNSPMFRSEGAGLADINNDGLLDLFMTSYLSTNRLFLNKNGVKFKEITKESGVNSNWGSISSSFGDINNDGLPDLYVCNWMGPNKLFLNKGKGLFEDITYKSGTSCGPLKRSNSAIFADFNNDGMLDLFVGNRGSGNKYFTNKGSGKFADETITANLNQKFLTYGAAAGDFDYNGWIDLAITDSSGVHLIMNTGLQKNGSIFFAENNNGIRIKDERFKGYNTGVALLDLDLDHDLDMVVGQNNGRIFSLVNQTDQQKKHNYIVVKLIGSESNRSAIGAKLWLYNNSKKIVGYREVTASSGYASCGTKIQYFALPDTLANHTLIVEFPSSGIKKKVIIKKVGALIEIHEHDGFTKSVYLTKKTLNKFVHSAELKYELIKSLYLVPLIYVAFLLLIGARVKVKYISRIPFNRTETVKLSCLIALSYLVCVILLNIYSYYFTSYTEWITDKKNILVMDYVPFIVSFLPLALAVLIKNKKLRFHSSDNNTISLLYNKLQSFSHGESSAMNLNRISLYLKNISSLNSKDQEVIERIGFVFDEFLKSTYPDLISLVELVLRLHNDIRFSRRKELLITIHNELNSKVKRLNQTILGISEKLLEKNKLLDLFDRNFEKEIEDIKEVKNLISKLIEIFCGEVNCYVYDVITSIQNKYLHKTGSFYELYVENKAGDKKVFINCGELEKILSIIIHNSIEAFSFNNSSKNVIRLATFLEGESIIIQIEDNGPGICLENIDKVFEEGYTSKGRGHGYGLYYVKKTLSEYDGKIYCSSIPTEKTVFTILLNQSRLNT
ncbi:MAG: FG-GAP-like repeat-containing protein [Melioribacteraceae bacterium]